MTTKDAVSVTVLLDAIDASITHGDLPRANRIIAAGRSWACAHVPEDERAAWKRIVEVAGWARCISTEKFA